MITIIGVWGIAWGNSGFGSVHAQSGHGAWIDGYLRDLDTDSLCVLGWFSIYRHDGDGDLKHACSSCSWQASGEPIA